MTKLYLQMYKRCVNILGSYFTEKENVGTKRGQRKEGEGG